MATYPLSGSTLKSTISTGLSTQILVKVENETIGAIQSLTIKHTRGLNKVRELGLDGILEIVPDKATEYAISVSRIVYDRLRLPEAFARGFINIKSQVLPFDIVIVDRTSGDGAGQIIHTLKNCWFSSYNTSYKVDSYILQEDVEISCEDISTTLGGTSASAVQGGARGVNYQKNDRERDTDTSAGGTNGGGGFRGTMDVSGLIGQIFK